MTKKYMDLKEFHEQGYVGEINRSFLHPLGLALEMQFDSNTNKWCISGVWDYREDPEGIIFTPAPDGGKAAEIYERMLPRVGPRVAALGYFIQPTEAETEINSLASAIGARIERHRGYYEAKREAEEDSEEEGTASEE